MKKQNNSNNNEMIYFFSELLFDLDCTSGDDRGESRNYGD